jgi:hypothetical protein
MGSYLLSEYVDQVKTLGGPYRWPHFSKGIPTYMAQTAPPENPWNNYPVWLRGLEKEQSKPFSSPMTKNQLNEHFSESHK